MTHLLEASEMLIDHRGDGLVVISIPVTNGVRQPSGCLHGGASIALSETTCLLGSANLIDTAKFIPLGLEVNANHVHSARDGRVIITTEIIR